MILSRVYLQAPIPVQVNSLMCVCKAYAKKSIKKQEQFLTNTHESINNLKPVSKKLKQTPRRK